MSPTLTLVLLLLPLAVYVMWPLFVADPDEVVEAPVEDGEAALELRKTNAYAALKEAEFDRRTGKLSDEDYDALVARYRSQALEAIAALEQRGKAAPATTPSAARGKARFCAQCGTAIDGAARFCSGCGTKLAA